MLLIPRQTEKSYGASFQNTYVFMVPTSASKQAIAKAVAEEYKVTVLKVKTLIRDGKAQRYSRGKHAFPGITFRQDKKYAYVTIKAGEKIPVFDEIVEAAEDKTAKGDVAAKEAKVTKTAEKTADKSEKTAKEGAK